MTKMLSTVPQTCPFTAKPSTQVRGRSSSTVSAALHRPQATLPVRLQELNCAKVCHRQLKLLEILPSWTAAGKISGDMPIILALF